MNFPLFPPQASEHAVRYDALFWTISGLTVLFTAIVGVMIYVFATKYRRGSNADRRNAKSHDQNLEFLLLGVPTVLGLAIFAWSSANFTAYRTPKQNEMEVFVIGKRWMWHMQHMNGIRENNELHIPVGRPIRLTMISQDVIHGFYLPEMRVQYQVVPGRYTQMWFTPTKPGRYHIFCAMHCGAQHSEMGGYVYVLPQAEFQQWVENGGNRFQPQPKTMAEAGKQIWDKYACGSCHGPKDNERGPSLYALFNSKRKLKNGVEVVADADYIRDSIYNPAARMTAGYENTMSPYTKEQISEEQMLNVIEYIKTLGIAPSAPSGTTPTTPDPLTLRTSNEGDMTR